MTNLEVSVEVVIDDGMQHWRCWDKVSSGYELDEEFVDFTCF